MNHQAAILESLGRDGRGLAVQFEWQADRYGHRILLVESAAVQPLIASVEGTSDQSFPPSPPLQSLHFETLPDGRRVALLVGLAGRSHWSASVETVPGSPVLVFDVACRTAGKLTQLETNYEAVSENCEPISRREEHGYLEFRWPQAGIRIAREASCESVELQMRPSSGVTIRPKAVLPEGLATIRWIYSVALIDGTAGT